jgi:hypothetical protein
MSEIFLPIPHSYTFAFHIFPYRWNRYSSIPKTQDQLMISFTHGIWLMFLWEPSLDTIPYEIHVDPSCYSLGEKVSTTTNCSKYVALRRSVLMWHHCSYKSISISQITFFFLRYKLCISIFHGFKKVQFLFNVSNMLSKF